MRRVACLAFTMCAFSCHGEKPETVLTVVEHHEPDRVVDTELGTLTLADQSWGFQKHIEDDGQPLEVFYRAEVSIELDEKAEGFEVVVPYEISVQTSSRAQQNSETKSQGASLEPGCSASWSCINERYLVSGFSLAKPSVAQNTSFQPKDGAGRHVRRHGLRVPEG